MTAYYTIPLFDEPTPAADLQDFLNQLIVELNLLLRRIQIATPVLQDEIAAALTEIPTVLAGGPEAIDLLGYNDAGDGGGGVFLRASDGSVYNSFQSFDGQWWAPSTGDEDQAFWSNGASNPSLTQPVYVNNSRNRWFIGAASGATPSRANTTYGWASLDVAPSWLARDAQVLVMPEVAGGGVVAMVRNSASIEPPTFQAGIALGGYAQNQNAATGAVWACYLESSVNAEVGGQPYAVSAGGLELNARNAGADYAESPYDLASGSSGAYGIAIAGGGDASNGPVTTHPSNFAIGLFRNGNYAFGGFHSGILVSPEAIDGTDGSDSETGTGVAIGLCRMQELVWYTSNFSPKVRVWSSSTTTGGGYQVEFADTGLAIRKQSGVSIFRALQVASGVNSIDVSQSIAGSPVLISAIGADTDIDVRIVPKGAGAVRFGTFTSNADAPVTGYMTIKDASGNVRKLATIA